VEKVDRMLAINIGHTLRLATSLMLVLAASARPSHASPTSLAITSDSEAERVFAQARNAWQARTEAPFLSYGILLRIANGSRHWDNWWEAYYRKSDQRFVVRRLVVPDDDEKRLKGTPLCIPAFGLKIFDTNSNAEPIFVEDPTIQAAESFGLLRSNASHVLGDLDSHETPSPGASAPPEIGRIQAVARDYVIELVNDEPDADESVYHLRLTPLHDQKRLRLRELWVSKDNYVTKKLIVDGISDGEPYDRARWVASYALLGGRVYLQQIKNEAPLHFGLTTLQQMEINFVDFRFPQQIPYYLFARTMSSRHTSRCGP